MTAVSQSMGAVETCDVGARRERRRTTKIAKTDLQGERSRHPFTPRRAIVEVAATVAARRNDDGERRNYGKVGRQQQEIQRGRGGARPPLPS
mmetsp:Transcript_40151/g.74239  ORF Transcript_40151/g.74239 Transcript_40151/m.74239 type:complete len:92 (+) Transcript_40151:228-503(+)